MKIIALDPGYERLGISVIEKNPGVYGTQKEKLLYSGCFKTSPKDTHSVRLKNIGEEIKRVIETYKPDALALEHIFFSGNQKTAISVSEARGVMLFQAALFSLPVYEYGPGQIKVAITGYGKSDKKAVTHMVQKLIHIEKEIKYDDEYDAIAVGLTCFAIERFS